MERYSDNPSGKIKGFGFVSFVVFILVVVGGYYFMYKDEFKIFIDEFKEAMEYESDYEFGDIDVENSFLDYIENEYIEVEDFEEVISDRTTYVSTVDIGAYDYKINFSSVNDRIQISSDSWPNTIDKYANEGDSWSKVNVYDYDYGFLVEIVGISYNTYYFIGYDLIIDLSLETPGMYGPVLTEEETIYFGHETDDGIDVYEYDCYTATYNLITTL